MKQIDFSRARNELTLIRKFSGKSLEQLSCETGLSIPTLSDLEDCDDLRNCISIGNLWRLCAALGIRPGKLFLEQYSETLISACDIENLSELIRVHLIKSEIPLTQFEEKIGFQIGEVLNCPPYAWGWNLDCLFAVCEQLNVDAQGFLI